MRVPVSAPNMAHHDLVGFFAGERKTSPILLLTDGGIFMALVAVACNGENASAAQSVIAAAVSRKGFINKKDYLWFLIASAVASTSRTIFPVFSSVIFVPS